LLECRTQRIVPALPDLHIGLGIRAMLLQAVLLQAQKGGAQSFVCPNSGPRVGVGGRGGGRALPRGEDRPSDRRNVETAPPGAMLRQSAAGDCHPARRRCRGLRCDSTASWPLGASSPLPARRPGLPSFDARTEVLSPDMFQESQRSMPRSPPVPRPPPGPEGRWEPWEEDEPSSEGPMGRSSQTLRKIQIP
jgi:hypothetical protein